MIKLLGLFVISAALLVFGGGSLLALNSANVTTGRVIAVDPGHPCSDGARRGCYQALYEFTTSRGERYQGSFLTATGEPAPKLGTTGTVRYADLFPSRFSVWAAKDDSTGTFGLAAVGAGAIGLAAAALLWLAGRD